METLYGVKYTNLDKPLDPLRHNYAVPAASRKAAAEKWAEEYGGALAPPYEITAGTLWKDGAGRFSPGMNHLDRPYPDAGYEYWRLFVDNKRRFQMQPDAVGGLVALPVYDEYGYRIQDRPAWSKPDNEYHGLKFDRDDNELAMLNIARAAFGDKGAPPPDMDDLMNRYIRAKIGLETKQDAANAYDNILNRFKPEIIPGRDAATEAERRILSNLIDVHPRGGRYVYMPALYEKPLFEIEERHLGSPPADFMRGAEELRGSLPNQKASSGWALDTLAADLAPAAPRRPPPFTEPPPLMPPKQGDMFNLDALPAAKPKLKPRVARSPRRRAPRSMPMFKTRQGQSSFF